MSESAMISKCDETSQVRSRHSKSVLIIEDNQDSAECIATLLSVLMLESQIECSRELALKRMEVASFDYIIMDFRMPGMAPDTFLKAARRNFPNIKIILISGNANVKQIAKTLGVNSSLPKPFDLQDLICILQR